MIIVMTTMPDKETAVKIGRGLLEKRLIACYNLWPIESGYWWKDEIVQESEIAMLLKTKDRWFEDIVDYIQAESGYETPEVVGLGPERIENNYQKWLNDEVN